MAIANEFVRFITDDLLGEIPDIRSRAMFGGWGIYAGKIMFGIVVDGELYFKVCDDTFEYKAIGSSPFVYKRKDGKKITMSYWKISEDILENREQLIFLAHGALRAAEKKRKTD